MARDGWNCVYTCRLDDIHQCRYSRQVIKVQIVAQLKRISYMLFLI